MMNTSVPTPHVPEEDEDDGHVNRDPQSIRDRIKQIRLPGINIYNGVSNAAC